MWEKRIYKKISDPSFLKDQIWIGCRSEQSLESGSTTLVEYFWRGPIKQLWSKPSRRHDLDPRFLKNPFADLTKVPGSGSTTLVGTFGRGSFKELWSQLSQNTDLDPRFFFTANGPDHRVNRIRLHNPGRNVWKRIHQRSVWGFDLYKSVADKKWALATDKQWLIMFNL